MTKDEWDDILAGAIRESNKDVQVVSSGCSDRSNRCFATIKESATEKVIEVGADQQDGAVKMQASVVRQLLVEEEP